MSSTANELERVAQAIEEATCLEDVFGLPGDDALDVAQHLRERWRKMARASHPDRFTEDEALAERAARVNAELNALHERAQAAAELGTYGTMSPLDDEDAAYVTTPRGRYRVLEALARGDLAMLYAGRAEDGERVVIKIVEEAGDNDLMLREARALERLHAEESPQSKHLPRLIDRLVTPEGTRAHVLSRFDGGLDLEQLRHRLGGAGAPPRHAVWIMRRCLSALGWAHSQGVVHGNLDPTHVMVRPEDHNVWLVDWCYSIIAPAKTGQGFISHNPIYSAPEVAERKPPLPASDLYSLGKCMFWVLGGDPREETLPDEIDERLARFVRFFVKPNPLGRPRDAWRMYKQLEELRDELFGPHRFVEWDI